jgi:hypothetical protein
LKKEKEEADSKLLAVDPKAKGKDGKPVAQAAAPKKEEAKKPDPKAAKKTP